MDRLVFSAILVISILAPRTTSLPLSTKGRWIIDAQTGQRVKLHCVNWSGHMPAVIPEGLSHRPIADIASRVAGLGFNCVRLTWSIEMVIKPQYRRLTVARSLRSLNLTDALRGVKRNNHAIVKRPIIEAFDAVVRALGDAGVMVILDNHVSKPMWCCGETDGNGFFGDLWFEPAEWIQGLQTMANRFKGVPNVIGMSLRNELRGSNSSIPMWYKYMTLGAQTVHAANPDILVVISGLNYDDNLSYLRDQSFPVVNDKIVFEAHWYAFTEGKRQDWVQKNPNWLCPNLIGWFDDRTGYVNHWARNGSTEAPLFLSEFEYNQHGADVSGNRYLSCLFAYATEGDIDWAIWALQGSYYSREGRVNDNENFGVLDWDWDQPQDPNFLQKFDLLQETLIDPSSTSKQYQIIYHPLTGMCLWADPIGNTVDLRDCKNRSRWSYGTGDMRLTLLDSDSCLNVTGDGQLVVLSTGSCNAWKDPRGSHLQLYTMAADARPLCMDWSTGTNSSATAVVAARECLCLDGEVCESGNPETQWFKVINSNIA